MAVHKGSEGIVKVGSNAVAEVTGFSFDETADTIETTKLSDSSRTYVSDLTSFSGSIECFFDETDSTGQGAMTTGASIALDLFPEGAGSGDTYFSGTAIITGISRSNAIGAIVNASFSFQGTGVLGTSTV